MLGSDTTALIDRIRDLPDLHLPAAHALLYTVLLADEAGMKINCSANAEEVVFTANPA